MTYLYIILILFYSISLPFIKYIAYKKTFIEKRVYGWHLIYFISILYCYSYLPLLYLNNINLGIKPESIFSIILIILTFSLGFLYPLSIKNKTVRSFGASFYAGFTEEFIYRGIIFGLAFASFNSYLIAIIISSIAFGLWHLKNIPIHGKKFSLIQSIYAIFPYGVVFAILRILTGDLYLSIFLHVANDAYHAIAPDNLRKWHLAVPYDVVKDS